jgi:hypothetical protein
MFTYRFTIRPAWVEHCPQGWVTISRKDPPTQWDFGTVTYPEPLPREVAEHWNLEPVGPELPKLVFEGEVWSVERLLGREAPDLCYRFRTEQIGRAEFEFTIVAVADDFEVEIGMVWPVES